MYYNGKNPTALKSQEMFMHALLDLMQEKPFAQISVQELCKRANLSRQTFYLLFATKENIIDYKFNRVFEKYADIIVKDEHLSTEKVVAWFAHFLKNEYFFIKMLVDNQLESVMVRHFRKYLCEIDRMLRMKERSIQNYAVAFLSGALSEIAAEYVRDEGRVSSEEISGMLYKILTSGYFPD